MSVGWLTDSDFSKHRSPFGDHPERPERLDAIGQHLIQDDVSGLLHNLTPARASDEQILAVHSNAHLTRVRDAAVRGDMLDSDTYVNEHSPAVAEKAAGCILSAVDAVYENVVSTAFCCVRPPGHHAESRRPMGFCLFNNIAIGARYAQRQGFHRIFIIDWDVHHGNGTQEIFYEDPTVFYMSLHEFPLYPGTGHASEIGKGSGEGYTLNIPLAAGSGDSDFLDGLETGIAKYMEPFRPDLVMVSAGFDAHERDPLAHMEVTTEGFRRMTEMVVEAADRMCGGRVISVLEGGYDLTGLGMSVSAHVQVLADA